METTPAILDAIMDVNIKAPFYLSQKCIPHLIKTQGLYPKIISSIVEKIQYSINYLHVLHVCNFP
jgi:NAD(P)-dependent dehydrogenase (short-subunit alcohol dehydrogenase family)